MAWEKDESGNIVIDDNGNPVWGNDAGEKKGVDYSAMSKSLTDTPVKASTGRTSFGPWSPNTPNLPIRRS